MHMVTESIILKVVTKTVYIMYIVEVVSVNLKVHCPMSVSLCTVRRMTGYGSTQISATSRVAIRL